MSLNSILNLTPNVKVIKIDSNDPLYEEMSPSEFEGYVFKVVGEDYEDNTVCVKDTDGGYWWFYPEDVILTDEKVGTHHPVKYEYTLNDTQKSNDKTKYDFYIASGFFTEQQIEEVEFIKNELGKRGFTYFSPKDDSAVEDINNPENRKKVFKLNEDAIRASKKMIANTNNKDMGTLFEAGMAYALGMDIIYVCFQLGKDGQLNLMLSESGVAACTTKEQFCEALDGKTLYWDGDIE